MKLLSSLMTPGGGMICLEAGPKKTLARVFFCKDDGVAILGETLLGLQPEEAKAIAEDLADARMPQYAKSKPLCIEGSAAQTFHGMCRYASALAAGSSPTFAVTAARAEVFSLFTSDDPRHLDGLLGYVDKGGLHHIAVFYSKEQAQSLVDTLSWLPLDKKKRLTTLIKRCELPRRSRQPRVTISGELAGWLNCAWEFTKQQRAAN